MTALTQSGYEVVDDYGSPLLLPNPIVPGSTSVIAGGLRRGAVATVILYYGSRFHAEVENLGIDPVVDDWGYDKRDIRGGSGWSNHAGGCAADFNSTRHPQHQRGTFSQGQYDHMRGIAAEMAGLVSAPRVLRLGIDWSDASVDEMHSEIAPDLAGTGLIERLAALIADGQAPNTHPLLITGGSAPAKPTTPTTPEDDVALTDDDKRTIKSIVREVVQTELGERAVLNPQAALNNGVMVRADLNFASRWGKGQRLDGSKF